MYTADRARPQTQRDAKGDHPLKLLAAMDAEKNFESDNKEQALPRTNSYVVSIEVQILMVMF